MTAMSNGFRKEESKGKIESKRREGKEKIRPVK
jgi:hypothetical protein